MLILVVSNLLPFFSSKTLIYREFKIKRALTSLFGIMSIAKQTQKEGANAHGHYTLFTSTHSTTL